MLSVNLFLYLFRVIYIEAVWSVPSGVEVVGLGRDVHVAGHD